jgi:hypothetical protein
MARPSLRKLLVDGDRREFRRLSRPPAGNRFLTGNGFADCCGVTLNYGPIRVNRSGRPGWWFCKADRLDELFTEHAPASEIVLVTHNSDASVDETVASYIDSMPIRAWFAANLEFDDPRLGAIPAGVANPHWRHGDQKLLGRVQASASPKSRLFDVSFSLTTNIAERTYCIEQTGLRPTAPRPYEAYLTELARAYFCISPRGNGIDCHRTWEALYLRTIPVVIRSILTDQHPDLPMIVLDDWAQFGEIEFSSELYAQTIGDWRPESLDLDRYLARLDARLDGIGTQGGRG